jgi:hypothetical protein
VAKRKPESLAETERLMVEVCEWENCKQALQRVKANKGSPGVDGMTVEELPDYLKQQGLEIGERLRNQPSSTLLDFCPWAYALSLNRRPPDADLGGVAGCVTKTRKRRAVRKMKGDPSEPLCRGAGSVKSCGGERHG